jgi:predicted DNA-binding transcriptional regulator YafY
VSEPTGRLLRLLSLLQSGQEWSGAELATRVGCSPRTIRRDVDRLRELGYPIDAARGRAGYRLTAGSEMPPLLLDDDEIVAVVIGLRTAAARHVTGLEDSAARATAKLERLLPGRLRRRVSAFDTVSVPEPAPGPTVDPQLITTMATACQDHLRLRLTYTDYTGTTSERVVDPHRLVHTGRRWYLLAHDRRRADWRSFRLDRLVSCRSTGGRFEPREIPGGDAAAFVIDGIVGRLRQGR